MAKIKMILQTSKVKLYYEKYGTGKPIILLHGNGEDHSIFNKSVAVLEKYFSVYVIDTRDHGNSSSVSELHYDDMAEDIYEFICKLQIEKPILYGFSDGGIIALLLCIKYPQLLSRVVVSGVNTYPNGLKIHWQLLFKLVYLFTRSSKLKLMMDEPNISNEMLQKIEIPVSITAGSRDMIKQKHLRNIADNISDSTLTIFQDETHDSYVVNSEKIADYIVEMVNKKR